MNWKQTNKKYRIWKRIEKKKQDRHREEEEKSIYVIKFEKNRRKTEKQKNSCPIELKIWADRRFI